MTVARQSPTLRAQDHLACNGRAKGLQIGLWEQVLWVKQPEETALTKDAFLLGRDGQPIRRVWNTSRVPKVPFAWIQVQAQGHGDWSIWSALAALDGMAIIPGGWHAFRSTAACCG